MGKQQKHGGKVFNFILGEETNLLGRPSFYVCGAMFQWGRHGEGGVVRRISAANVS